jgi:hypothetical protein
MGVSTDGILLYGWLFEEDTEFPWDKKECRGDEEQWWHEVNGYKPPFQLFTEDGEYIDGKEPTDKMVTEYFNHQCEWDKANLMPFKVVNYCSDNYPMYAIAVGKVIEANRGYPVPIKPSELVVDPADAERVKAVLAKHGLELEGEPRWWLASYWG